MDTQISERKFKVFVDFDGTITTKDVGEELFLKFGNDLEVRNAINLWAEGKISSVENWHLLCESVDIIDENELMNFIDSIEIEYSFKDFYDFCKSNNIELIILSDGFDYYIKRILNREFLSEIKLFCNQLKIENSYLIPRFPHRDEECKICGNCKRNHVIENSSDDDITIYIGDGLSDKCPAQYCDFIFAKKSLLRYCEINRITYWPYNNFFDIKKRISEMMNKKRIKKNHQSLLKRREDYLKV